jgi:hypothetical protein
VAFGPPVPVPEEGSRRQRAARLTADVRDAIERLLEPMVRERP